MPKVELEYINEEDRVMRKIMIAVAAIILIIELVPLIIAMICGAPIYEMLLVLGIFLVGQCVVVLISYAIIRIVEWAVD